MSCHDPARTPLPAAAIILWLSVAFHLCAQPVIRDGGVNPANLGKGDWIWYVSWATNRLGGAAPSVVNVPTLMAYYKAQGLQYIVVKAGTGSTNFLGGGSSPQFNSNLVHHAHAAGLLIFAYTRSFDDDVPGEIAMAERCFALGADGWVIDAEAEWEDGPDQAGPNGPARALEYGAGLRARFPGKFIAHAPFPIISYHRSFPYKEFGYYCDAVMPQAYWKSIYGNAPDGVARMVTAMNDEYRAWQSSLAGLWTNAIKPIAPIGQNYNPSATEITTAAEVDEFLDRLRTNPAPASVTGYRSASFWRTDTKTGDIWTAIRTNTLGDTPGLPQLTLQPESRSVVAGADRITFTAWGTGSKPFHYAWRFHDTNLTGANSPNLILTNVQPAHAGPYSVIVSNVSGVTTSLVAMLTVVQPPTLFDIAAVAGARSAIVTWTSTNAATSQVEYGLDPNLGQVTAEDLQPVNRHSVLLPDLQPGLTYHFAVVSRSAGAVHRAAGWILRTTGELLLDNDAASYTGTWSVGTTAPDKFGPDYRFAATAGGAGTASAIFSPAIGTPGRYDVFLWHPDGSNRSTNTPVIINFNGGATVVRVNQSVGGGAWRPVGTNLPFRAGTSGSLRISNQISETNRVVVADAIRLVYRPDQDRSPTPAVPDWWALHYFGQTIDPLEDHDGDGLSAWAEYLAGTDPTQIASRLQLWSTGPEDGSVHFHFSPALGGRRYHLERRTEGGPWETVAAEARLDPAAGAGRFVITPSPGTVHFYRLKVEWME